MTSRYENGKIYKLVNSVDNKIYIGSTCQPLYKRLYEHKKKSKYRNHLVYTHLNSIGWDSVRIILIEEVKAYNKQQLLQREQHYIDLLNPSLNKISAYVNCPHGREHNNCKECGGASICGHDRIKSRCKECGGASICEHNRQKSRCKECDGSQICGHDRIKSRCKECLGDKYYCYECEINFGSLYQLTQHEKTKKHKDNYDEMFKEVFLD